MSIGVLFQQARIELVKHLLQFAHESGIQRKWREKNVVQGILLGHCMHGSVNRLDAENVPAVI